MPFWGLLYGDLNIQAGQIFIDKFKIPLTKDNKILVNLSDPANYWKNTFSLVNILKSARNKETLKDINQNDIIVILTGMYVGSTSIRTTPAGNVPGGFIMVEVINSILKNSWLTYNNYEVVLLFIYCLLGFLISYLLSPRVFWISLLGIETLTILISLSSFIFFGFVISWGFPFLGLLLTGISVYAEKTRITENKVKSLKISFEGMLEPGKLNQIIENPEKYKFYPKSQVLTVMFVDIVGFSILAERESPAEVFDQLRNLLGMVSDIVHSSGGIIDRSLGDGLLCFFGYQFEPNALPNYNHAEQALKCAEKIQNTVLEKDFASYQSNKFLFPLRIGINTGEVYIGDLGGKHKIDFTIIGHSVNFAQRLESACDNYLVMCGPTTFDSLDSNFELKSFMTRKFIPIKHHAEAIESYEFNPFQRNTENLQRLKLLIRKLSGTSRSDIRWDIQHDLIKVTGSFGNGSVTNYSKSGLAIESDTLVGRGSIINFSIKTNDNTLENDLKKSGIYELSAVVRWSWNEGNKYRIGLKFLNLNPEMQDSLLFAFRNFTNNNI